MNKKILSVFIVLTLLFGLVACASNPKPETPVKPDITVNEHILDDIKSRGYLIVGCKMDVPDLSFYDASTDTWSGLEVELAYEIAARLFETDVNGAKADNLVKFTGVTVADREEKLQSGEIDLMLATYTYTDERANKFSLSESYYTDYIGIMVRDYGYDNDSLGSVGIKSIADLDGKYIGVPRNATTRDTFINYASTMSTVSVSPIFCEFDSYETLYQALIDGKIDAMSVDVSILNGYDDANTIILGERFGAQRYSAAASLANQPLIDLVNEII